MTGKPVRAQVWTRPIVVVGLLMALLSLMYLGYVVNPEKNLHDFPIALVNQDVGDTLGGQPTNVGDQIATALAQNIPADKVDLTVTGIPEMQKLLLDGKIYGAIIIPNDFTKRLGILGTASVVSGKVERPVITIQTNPRIGSYATSITLRITEQALAKVNETVGRQLTDTVDAQLRPTPDTAAPPVSGAAQLTLAEPVDVVITPFRPLPDGTGGGLSAFFYTLLVLLAGFTGAMIIHTMVDAALGFTPTEYGPWYVHYPSTPISRLRTLLLKWGIVAIVAPLVSAVFLAVATLLDMPIDRAPMLFLYSTLAIIAVGVTALSVLAAFGSAGLLVNLILFIVLGLPSAGGSVPIEATPKAMGWLSTFEPMHQVFLGIRAILYFDARGSSGLAHGTWMTLLGLLIGLCFGAAITAFYDRKGLHRSADRTRVTEE
ncbi:YhgE/Pip domain-containing protein [Nocardia sp. NPDC056000]|uniref:YhgE/Pip domain-containing protein n=1 Tax=Nocardia sp. NPDC056000 TaxID=3345674 RepID=UPI0035D5B977